MKRNIFTLLAFALIGFATNVGAQNEKPFVVPEVTSWKGAPDGQTQPTGRIIVRSKELRPVAEQLAADFEYALTRKGTIVTGKPKAGDIVLTCKKLDNMSEEGYRIKIDHVVEIEAPSAKGAFWATRTLLQIMEMSMLPHGEIIDEPQYKMRGFMIDVGRKFVPMGYLRNLVRIMAYYKMNTLQIHLNDKGEPRYFENNWDKTSAAFRLECDTYPGLAAKDGHYTKQEFIELQKLAESLHVEIIPEIDAPAHALAFTHYRPELGSKVYGMDHFDLSNPDIYPFMDNLYAEYLSGKEPVFRGPRVNIGTDEYSNRDQEVVEQFRAFTDHYLTLIKKYNKQPALWGALTHAKGKTPVQVDGVLMNCWYNPYAQPDSMIQLGYQVVSIPDRWLYIVPAAGYYYDYLNCEFLYNNWTPAKIADKTFPEQHPQIEGGMFAVWNDHYGNGISTKDIHHRLYPAMQTVAAKCWTGQKTTLPYADFDKKRKMLSEAPGVNEMGHIIVEQKLASIEPGKKLGMEIDDAGFGYAVSFDIDCQAEEKGTILTRSNYAIFYLSDAKEGKLAFERDGYINRFNYQLPASGRVSIRIECTNRETRLFVNNRRQQVLAQHDVYVIKPENKLQHMTDDMIFCPTVYEPGMKMSYVPTLCFPLLEGGNFKSKVTNLHITKL